MNDKMPSNFNETPPEPPGFSNEPPPYTPVEKPGGMAIASMIVGICSIVFCCGGMNLLLGIVAVILGFIERSNINNGSSPEAGKVYAMTGIITGIVGVLVFFILIFSGVGLGILSAILEDQGY